MVNATPPPNTTQEAVLKQLKPEIEIVSSIPDTLTADTSKNIHFYDALENFKEPALSVSAGSSFSPKGTFNPYMEVDISIPGVDIVNWTDAGFVGDFETRSNIKKVYSETFLDIFPNFPVHPVGQYDMQSHGPETKRLGIATKPIKIKDRVNLKVNYCPWSDFIYEDGGREKEFIVFGNGKITDDLSLYGMYRNFHTKMKEKGVNLGLIGAQYEVDDGVVLFLEYRNFPMMGGRYSAPFIGVKFRKDDIL